MAIPQQGCGLHRSACRHAGDGYGPEAQIAHRYSVGRVPTGHDLRRDREPVLLWRSAAVARYRSWRPAETVGARLLLTFRPGSSIEMHSRHPDQIAARTGAG